MLRELRPATSDYPSLMFVGCGSLSSEEYFPRWKSSSASIWQKKHSDETLGLDFVMNIWELLEILHFSPSLTSISCCCSRTWNLFIKQHQQQACKNRHYTIINNVADSSDTRQLFNVFCVSLFLSVQSSILKFFSVGDWYKLSLLMLEIFKLASEQGKHIMDFNGSEFPCFSLVLGRASVQWWRSVINSATVSRNRKYK